MTNLHYPSGFGNEFATEALPGALPVGRNSPQRYACGFKLRHPHAHMQVFDVVATY